jgi:hypothetical protein
MAGLDRRAFAVKLFRSTKSNKGLGYASRVGLGDEFYTSLEVLAEVPA